MTGVLVGLALVALGGVFLVAGITGRPKAVIGIEDGMGQAEDKAPPDVPESPIGDPPQAVSQMPTRIPVSRRYSTIALGVVGLFVGIISIMGATIW